MKKAELITWIEKQQPKLDAIIAKAGREFYKENRGRDNFGFDLAECQYESYNLIRGEDLCYDRPNTAFTYSLWYHGRRVNTFLTYFAETIYNSTDKEIEVFDLGAGTGAVQWAIGLVYHKMKLEGKYLPKIKFVNVDTSPFMLYYSKDFLWKYFIAEYTACKDFSNQIEYEINSWSNQNNVNISNPWITASYLFDISDTSNTSQNEYKKAALKGFQEIIDNYNPSRFLLLTALSKETLVDTVSREFDKKTYNIKKIKNYDLALSGELPKVNEFRKELFDTYKDNLLRYEEKSLRNSATWDDRSFVGTIIEKKQSEFFTSSTLAKKISLHSSRIKVRRDVSLNDEQKAAAENNNRPTVIIGPAGCGKSIVITERIKNIVEGSKYNPNLKILLTTFNKELLGQLTDWLLDILDAEKYTIKYDTNGKGYNDKSSKIYFNGSIKVNIRILHFDMLPKFLGAVPYGGLVNDDLHWNILENIIVDVKKANNIKDARHDNFLNPEFLLEEYRRVIYGLQVGVREGGEERYATISRRGRGNNPKLDKKSDRRAYAWQCLNAYAKYIHDKKIPCFTLRRQYFLSKLKNKEVDIAYDYIIVDEFQDCTKADFEIFFHLLKDPNNLIISGDLAQAVHLGRSANVEVLREVIRRGRDIKEIDWNYLKGSYRLPLRISEAIFKISEHIHSFRKSPAASILTPFKSSPPGARPIVVYGKDEIDISKKILSIISAYHGYDIEELCILEEDKLLSKKIGVNTDTVLRLKGMEKHCVIWSTRATLDFKKEKFEFVYTILSRTSCLLIIALFEDTQEIYKEAIGLFRREDRLIYWDKETKDCFASFCEEIENNITDDDDE